MSRNEAQTRFDLVDPALETRVWLRSDIRIDGKVLGAEHVPLPPVSEQHAITARLDTELNAARTLAERLEARLAEIELLPATLLRAAFDGKC